MKNEKLRNVAIIAHVDHGKTTLVDEMLKQGGVYRENQETVERVMDSNELERERGITILAKNTAIQYGDTKINIVDTPGHADFGGEVERILKMVNGVILLVDAAEGAMPQTRFVLSRALELGHRVIVVVNKIDRPDQRIHEVVDEVLELLLDLDATDDQLDSPMLFCSGRQGIASYSPDVPGTDLKPLFDTILDYIPAPEANADEPFQMLVSSIDYNEFVGRIAIGRIERGTLKQNQEIAVCNYHNPDAPARKAKAVSLYEFDGLGKKSVTESTAGNIIALSGIGDITIGDTICAPDCVEPLPFVKNMYYLDVNFYRYYIGRVDQSVNEQVMIGRIDQQLLVNRLMIDYLTENKGEVMKNKRLYQYMRNYLEIIMTISSALALRSGSEENLEKKQKLWQYLKEKDRTLYYWMRRGIMGEAMNLPGKLGRSIAVESYKVCQKIFKFN